MSKENKKIIVLIGSLISLLVVAAFIIFSLNDKPEPVPVVEEEKIEEHSEDDGHPHEDIGVKDVIYDPAPDKAAKVSTLELGPPKNVPGAYNPNSSTDFKGAFKDERLYVMGAKGQFYYYNMDTKKVFTYENLVREAAVDKLTGDVVLTREIEGNPGKVGVYKALKTYPDRVLIHETNTDATMEEAAFFKNTVIMNFFDEKTRKASTLVKPMNGNDLNAVGQGLAKSLNGNQFNFSTDGNRLFAYDSAKNAIVELTSGSPVIYHQFNEPVNGVVTEVLGKNVLFSYNRLSDYSGFTLYNKQVFSNQSFGEIEFYDNDFAFVSNDEQAFLLDILVQDFTPLTQKVVDISVSSNNLYFTTDVGDIQKINIKKSAE